MNISFVTTVYNENNDHIPYEVVTVNPPQKNDKNVNNLTNQMAGGLFDG